MVPQQSSDWILLPDLGPLQMMISYVATNCQLRLPELRITTKIRCLRADQELEDELLKQDPSMGYVSPLALSIATATLNARIRKRGLSSREMLCQRDQFSYSQLPISDRQLIISQNDTRTINHPYSEKSKAPGGKVTSSPSFCVGDLVYLHDDKNKSKAKDRCLVVSVEGQWCNIQKFPGPSYVTRLIV